MSQRLYAAVLAGVLLFALVVAASLLPLPYVTYSPGITVNVLGTQDGEPIVQVEGHRSFRDDGQLRMTTVYVTQPGGRVTLLDAMEAWLSDEKAVYPYDALYGPDETAEDSRTESAVQMVSSQDAATAVALRELGYRATPVVEVLDVTEGMPAEGRLKVRDVITRVGTTDVRTPQDVVDALQAAPAGEPVEFGIQRNGKPMTVEITPRIVDGHPRVGVVPGPGYDFPFDVTINIDPNIGGPSAGLMFSLGIYDTLTPGSLTDGQTIAGTGTIDPTGKVGPIGGIQQKIVAARDAGAELFLVPADNCQDALGAPRGDMELVRVDTMHSALTSVQQWAEDPGASLPSCTAGAA